MPKPRADDYDLANRAELLMDQLQTITEAFDGVSDTSPVVEEMRKQIHEALKSAFNLAVEETFKSILLDVEAAQGHRPPFGRPS